MYSSSASSTREIPNSPHLLPYLNPDRVLVCLGPRNGILWRSEEVDLQATNLIGGFKSVFQHGFTQKNESVLARLPYMQLRYERFVCASDTYCVNDHPIGFDNEQLSAGDYGYVYMIDSSQQNNIHSVPLCEENIINPEFVAGYSEETEITEGPEYAIVSELNARFIVGAVPSSFIAYALGIHEKSFIINPYYLGTVSQKQIKEVSGVEYNILDDEHSPLSLRHPNLSIGETYKCYLQAEKNKQNSTQQQSRSNRLFTFGSSIGSSFLHQVSNSSGQRGSFDGTAGFSFHKKP
jgi:hypothetical protein